MKFAYTPDAKITKTLWKDGHTSIIDGLDNMIECYKDKFLGPNFAKPYTIMLTPDNMEHGFYKVWKKDGNRSPHDIMENEEPFHTGVYKTYWKYEPIRGDWCKAHVMEFI